MGVLATRSAYARPSARPPINMSTIVSISGNSNHFFFFSQKKLNKTSVAPLVAPTSLHFTLSSSSFFIPILNSSSLIHSYHFLHSLLLSSTLFNSHILHYTLFQSLPPFSTHSSLFYSFPPPSSLFRSNHISSSLFLLFLFFCLFLSLAFLFSLLLSLPLYVSCFPPHPLFPFPLIFWTSFLHSAPPSGATMLQRFVPAGS